MFNMIEKLVDQEATMHYNDQVTLMDNERAPIFVIDGQIFSGKGTLDEPLKYEDTKLENLKDFQDWLADYAENFMDEDDVIIFAWKVGDELVTFQMDSIGDIRSLSEA